MARRSFYFAQLRKSARQVHCLVLLYIAVMAVIGCNSNQPDFNQPEQTAVATTHRTVTPVASISRSDDGGHVTIAASLSKQPMSDDQAINAEVAITIQSGFHVYSSVDATGPFIPLTVKASVSEKAIRVLPVTPPTASDVADGKPVYRESVTVLVPLEVEAGFVGNVTLSFEVNYQACNDLACFPPETLQVDIPIAITHTKSSQER